MTAPQVGTLQTYGRGLNIITRFLNSTPLPFLFWGLLIKTEYQEKGYPYYLGATQEPRN